MRIIKKIMLPKRNIRGLSLSTTSTEKTILQSLIDSAKLQNENFERTLRIIVFSRFDGRIVNPFDDAVVYKFRNGSDMPALDLYLYNTTENSHTGLHYDPVTVRGVDQRNNTTKT